MAEQCRQGVVFLLGAGLTLPLPAHAQENTDNPFAALAEESRPLHTRWETDYDGVLEGGIGYVSEDNFMFGQYNGLYDQGAVVIGTARWRGWRGNGPQYWNIEARDLGLETRRGVVQWGIAGRMQVGLLFDNQVQVKNDTARTPFLGEGSSNLVLPGDWVPGANTSDWTRLYPALQGFDQKLERHKYGISFDTAIAGGWSLRTQLSSEQKEGTATVGAAIYSDASSPLGVLLPQPVDQRTTDFDLGFDYRGQAVQLDASYRFTDFDNQEDLLTWQNPYSAGYGPVVDYPNGIGGLALAPDNRYHRLRLTGAWLIIPKLRMQWDGSYGRTEQNADLPLYTVNPGLVVDTPVPITSLDGKVDTATLGINLIGRPLRKLTLEGRYRLDDRRNDSPRDGYLYVRGDGANQPAPKYTNYNAPHDTRKQTAAIEGAYRLPKRMKLIAEYAFQRVDRRNAAVEHTNENSLRAQLNINTWQPLSARVEIMYADLAADTYDWAQSYYARFDTELINETPDTQRYTEHPLLSQYHLSNRERLLGKVDLNYLLNSRWNLGLNMLWRRDDFDKSTLGLTEENFDSYVLSANYSPRADLSFSAYANYNRYGASQTSRAFRGGAEKNAFVTVPPLPQASDPSRNWDVDSDDTTRALGLALEWLLSERVSLDFDYSFVDTQGENSFKTYGAPDITTAPLPDRETLQHQFRFSGSYHLRDNLSLNLHYQYFHFVGDNWAIDDVAPDSVDKVLTFGEQSPDESVNYIGLSVSYRLRQ